VNAEQFPMTGSPDLRKGNVHIPAHNLGALKRQIANHGRAANDRIGRLPDR
jgi:hypothetical protein